MTMLPEDDRTPERLAALKPLTIVSLVIGAITAAIALVLAVMDVEGLVLVLVPLGAMALSLGFASIYWRRVRQRGGLP